MTQPDSIMDRIAEAQQQAASGQRAAARAAFAAVWDEVGTDGDPLHVVTLAHYMADVQDDPADELEWDLCALRAVETLTDERAQRHHSSLAVRGFYPSLHLNVANDYAKLDEPAAAREHLVKAEAAAPDLSDDGYGTMIRNGITHLRAQLDQQDGVS